ncbi:hypothetical protein [Naumannella halotolerans]|uniref:Uncharacterized protein n=1 Tax=Naumannella halotolerans TaxID=993414 RepID=A0A4R7J2I3_9ACTN|nr:hypothetical protein [Naumannella halotolerans]TDT31225.1 hypothetical protein CLV29_2639 [Naumannella halotolerans]
MDEYFRLLRQGHVLELTVDAQLGDLSVIVSQSCDVVQPKREFLQVAPLVEINNKAVRRGAMKKENPRFPVVTTEERILFADLAQIRSLPKTEVEDVRVLHDLSITDTRDARDFGLAVGRWFGRFAVPDKVQPWLAPVQTLIREKHDSPDSPLGKILQRVAEVRIEAVDWDTTPVELTLHVIAKAGSVPTIPDDADLSRIGSMPSDLTKVCEAILSERDPIRQAMLWGTFAESLADKCAPKGQYKGDPEVTGAVLSVSGELSSDDEFPLSRARRSEQLDVDFLSDPTPY